MAKTKDKVKLYTRRYPRGVSYTLDYFEHDTRKRVALGFITQHDAETARIEKELELRGIKTDRVRDSLIFMHFATEYLEWYAVAHPSSYYRIEQIFRQHFLPVFGSMPLEEITVRRAEKYAEKRQQPIRNLTGPVKRVKKETVNKELRQLKAAMNKAVDWEKIPFNPIARLKFLKVNDSKQIHTFTKKELLKIYKASDRAHWWQLLANTGMRVSEAQHLKWDDINSKSIRILSTEEKRTKSGLSRSIPLFKGAEKALNAFDQSDEFVYPQMVRTSFSRIAKQDIQAVGLTGSAHTYRHTFCTMLLDGGMDLPSIQKLAGHSTIKVTEKYLHPDLDGMKDKVNLNL